MSRNVVCRIFAIGIKCSDGVLRDIFTIKVRFAIIIIIVIITTITNVLVSEVQERYTC